MNRAAQQLGRILLAALVLGTAAADRARAQATAAAAEPDGATLLQRAAAAAGGQSWLQVKTLVLSGHAVFWGPSGSAPRSSAASYTMWRVFDPARGAAHGAEGQVRIVARTGEQLMFTVGYDGRTTWTERGITPQAEADAFWANNFGFGIIRHAGKPGFKAERVADGYSQGHAVRLVRLTDPQGGVSLFGIDPQTDLIRSVGFSTPRGWHERHYDKFVRQDQPPWVQAREVTLYYNGVKANTLYWDTWVVDGPVDAKLFAPPERFPPPAVP